MRRTNYKRFIHTIRKISTTQWTIIFNTNSKQLSISFCHQQNSLPMQQSAKKHIKLANNFFLKFLIETNVTHTHTLGWVTWRTLSPPAKSWRHLSCVDKQLALRWHSTWPTAPAKNTKLFKLNSTRNKFPPQNHKRLSVTRGLELARTLHQSCGLRQRLTLKA